MKFPRFHPTRWTGPLAIALLVGCAGQPESGAEDGSGTAEAETAGSSYAAGAGGAEVILRLPVSTELEPARQHLLAGLDRVDMLDFVEGNEHFEAAVEADPSFAFGYLQVANSSTSLAEFTTNLARAEEHAEGASRAEQLMIEISRKGFDSDREGQLAAAQELVQVQPESPRAWLALAGVQTGLDRNEEARASMRKAIELAPSMAAAHMRLGNSFLFSEPKDFAEAETHMRRAVELRPGEPNTHDLLGDVHRAQGNLEAARADYTRAAELAPEDGSPIQQRGHVNSFLGDYEAARADFDRAMELGKANERPAFAVFKAFIHVHAGEPQRAIDELVALADRIDGMGIPEPTGLKINALTNAVTIALHEEELDQAAQLIARTAALMRKQAEQVGTDPFRRGQEAGIAYLEGMLAAKRGDFQTARARADRIAELVEPDANPRKMEPVHELRGAISFEQGKPGEAAEHFRQGNLNNTYIEYWLARSLEAAGRTEEARALYEEIANNNFNSVGFALTRREAAQKAAA